MISVTGFHMTGAQRFKCLDDLREDSLLPFNSLSDARAELLSLFPKGTQWPENGAKGEWHGSESGWMEATVDLPHSVLIHTWAIDGEVLEALRRMYDTGHWLLVLVEEGEVFHPHNPAGQ